MAELEVDAFAGGLGRDEDLCLLAEAPLLVDPLTEFHAAVDHRDLEVRAQLFDEELERVLVLGEDQQLLGGIVPDAVLLQDLPEFIELDLAAESLGFLCLRKQRTYSLEFCRDLLE